MKPFVFGRGPRERTARSTAIGGTPRVPSSATNMSKSELVELGKRMGWNANQELSMTELQNMDSAQYRYQELLNPNFQSAFERAANVEHNKETMKVVDTRRMWSGKATDEESTAAQKAANEFAQRYPAFVRHTENANAIARYMQQNDLDATRVQSYAEAFTALATEGAITLSPKDAGVGPESRLSGDELKSYAKLYLLVQPSPVLRPEDKLSADQYFQQHPELDSRAGRVPPLIARDIAKRKATEDWLKQTQAATNRSGSTALIDYETNRSK